jgi:PPOX class probable F420-dependent enzyme
VRKLGREEALDFMAAGRRTGMVATVRADGSPDVVPIWFVVDAGDVVFTCASASVKARNLARDPRAALSVDDPEWPCAFVTVRGPVELVSPEDMEAWTVRIAGRYVDDAAEVGRRNAGFDDLLVRLKPASILARVEIGLP